MSEILPNMISKEIPEKATSLSEQYAEFKKNGEKLKETTEIYGNMLKKLELEKTKVEIRMKELKTKKDSMAIQKKCMKVQMAHFEEIIKQDSMETEATELKIAELRRKQIMAEANYRTQSVIYQRRLKQAKLDSALRERHASLRREKNEEETYKNKL